MILKTWVIADCPRCGSWLREVSSRKPFNDCTISPVQAVVCPWCEDQVPARSAVGPGAPHHNAPGSEPGRPGGHPWESEVGAVPESRKAWDVLNVLDALAWETWSLGQEEQRNGKATPGPTIGERAYLAFAKVRAILATPTATAGAPDGEGPRKPSPSTTRGNDPSEWP